MIHVTQYLCPARHCAFALAWDDATMTRGEVEVKAAEVIASGAVNDRCGICGEKIAPEHRQTGCASVEEAYANILLPGHVAQMATRRMLDDMGLTKEKLPMSQRRWNNN